MEHDATKQNQNLISKLVSTETFREYQKAFSDATSLPLALRPVIDWKLAHHNNRRQNGFCALMARTNHSCAACLQLQQKLCDGTVGGTNTLQCIFDLHETALEVKMNGTLVGYLQTGQIFFKTPSPQQTSTALKKAAEMGIQTDPEKTAKLYNATPVIPEQTYQAIIQILQYFASQLGMLAHQITVQEQTAEPEQITRARRYIDANSHEKLTLTRVAQQAGMSMFYFCKIFRETTGMHFTHYISHARVEKARQLMLNKNFHISEIAFEVGFQSLTHFNRVFKKTIGQSPTEYRNQTLSR